MFLFPASATTPLRLYLDESGTLGFGDEVFTMAMVLVNDLAKLEGSIARNKTTQAEIKASQMKTAQKLALAHTLLDENDLQVFLLTIDPEAALACERKLDKELLYDSMIAQAMAYYLQRGELPRDMAYRLSLDMRGGIRESFEDMVRESIGNVLMHRDEPLVADLQIRYMDSKYSAGVQAADLFSNIYRTALSQGDSPCNGFLHKYQQEGIVHAGFAFGLPQLADQMSQIAADLRARVEFEATKAQGGSSFRALPNPEAPKAGAAVDVDEKATEHAPETPRSEHGSRTRRHRGSGRGLDAGTQIAQTAAQTEVEALVETPVEVRGHEDAGIESVGFIEIAALEEGVAPSEVAEPGRGLSRSARRRRSRAARKAAEASAAALLDLASLTAEDGDEARKEDEADAGESQTVAAQAEVPGEAEQTVEADEGTSEAPTVAKGLEPQVDESIAAAKDTQADAVVSTPEVAETPAAIDEPEKAVTDVHPGRTARSRRQMAAEKSQATKAATTRKRASKKAAPVETETVASETQATTPTAASAPETPAPETPAPVSEPATAKASDETAAPATPSSADAPAESAPEKPAPKTTRTRRHTSKAKAAPAAKGTSDQAQTALDQAAHEAPDAAPAESALPAPADEAAPAPAKKPSTRRRTHKQAPKSDSPAPAAPTADAE